MTAIVAAGQLIVAVLCHPRPGRASFSFKSAQISDSKVAIPGSGGREDRTMSGDYDWKERRDQVERYRILEQETTDPIAARLLHDIVLDLEAELKRSPQSAALDAA